MYLQMMKKNQKNAKFFGKLVQRLLAQNVAHIAQNVVHVAIKRNVEVKSLYTNLRKSINLFYFTYRKSSELFKRIPNCF